jgi:DNA-binding response OmpR family regulator
LLLIPQGITPPPGWDPLEDWVRVPADPDELHARITSVRRRATAGLEPAPRVDADSMLWHRGRWVALPPIEAALMRLLADRHGALVGREALVAAAWRDGISDRRALDARIKMLRRRIRPLDLAIRTVPRRGFLLEPL